MQGKNNLPPLRAPQADQNEILAQNVLPANKLSLKPKASLKKKIIIPLGLFLILLAVMLVFNLLSTDLGKNILNQQNIDKPAQASFNFDAPLPDQSAGDLNSVPQEKIDSLFDNLKQ